MPAAGARITRRVVCPIILPEHRYSPAHNQSKSPDRASARICFNYRMTILPCSKARPKRDVTGAISARVPKFCFARIASTRKAVSVHQAMNRRDLPSQGESAFGKFHRFRRAGCQASSEPSTVISPSNTAWANATVQRTLSVFPLPA